MLRCNLCNTPVSDGQPPRWCKDGYEILSCRSCGLLFRSELPTAHDLLSIYTRGYSQTTAGGIRTDMPTT